MALRQTTRVVERLLGQIGLAWDVPDFGTLSLRQQIPAVNSQHRGPQGPLHPLIDSLAIKEEGERKWNERKCGDANHFVWRKVNFGIDEEILTVSTVKVISSDTRDAPILIELLSKISSDLKTANVTGDYAYDTPNCHNAFTERSVYGVIPPRKNAKPWKAITAGAVTRNEVLQASKQLSRALWQRRSGSHSRSCVETKMHCVKLMGNTSWRGTSSVKSMSPRSMLQS